MAQAFREFVAAPFSALARPAAAQSATGASYELPIARTAFVLSVGILIIGYSVIGARPAADTPRYLQVGDHLLHWFRGNGAVKWDVFTTMYLFPNVVTAAGFRLLGAAFPRLFVLMNIVFYSSAVYLCFRVWELFGQLTSTKSLVAGLLVVFGFADVPMWTFYVLADITFLFVVLVFWYYLAKAVLFTTTRSWIAAFAIAVSAAAVRPTAIVLIGFWFTAAAFMYLRVRGCRREWIALAFIALPFVVAEILWPYVIYRIAAHGGLPRVMPTAFNELVPWYLNGSVVCDRLETYLAPPVAYLDFVRITVVRLFYFFFPLRAGYSHAHNLSLALYTPLLVTCGGLGWKRLVQRGGAAASFAFLLLAFTYYFGLFHSMTYVDYDWRYQLPAMASAYIIGGFGVARLFEPSLQR